MTELVSPIAHAPSEPLPARQTTGDAAHRIGGDERIRRVRLRTQMRLRWFAVVAQTATVLGVWLGLGYPLPVVPALVIVALSAAVNLFFEFRRAEAMRLTPALTQALLGFDIVQLAALLFLTGGAENPFVMLMVGPVIVAAATLSGGRTFSLAALAIALVTILSIVSFPLPWVPGERLVLPEIITLGMWTSMVVAVGFTSLYTYRVAREGRELENALAATELALEREQNLSALDGLAAAAAHELGTPLATVTLVAKELQRSHPPGTALGDDIALIRDQAQRCREILKRLSSLTSEDEQLASLRLPDMIDEVVAPHREFGIDIEVRTEAHGPPPTAKRSAGVMYGLGNIVENAVDFARARVDVRLYWDDGRVAVRIADDGPGFPPELMGRFGEPYISRRGEGGETAMRGEPGPGSMQGGGLGLGLFIARTLLERSGAEVTLADSSYDGRGATVLVEWPRATFERGGRTGLDG